MNTAAAIIKKLPTLSFKELQQVERALIDIYRQRKQGIIFDDSYGVWTEADQAAVAAEMFKVLDQAERKQDERAAGRRPALRRAPR